MGTNTKMCHQLHHENTDILLFTSSRCIRKLGKKEIGKAKVSKMPETIENAVTILAFFVILTQCLNPKNSPSL